MADMAPQAELSGATAERILAFWRSWAATPDVHDTVSLVAIGDEQFVYAPARLRVRFDGVPFTEAALSEALGDDLVELVGEARLAYADAATLRLVPFLVAVIDAGDPRLAALRDGADPVEWEEASAGDAAAYRVGVVEHGELVATGEVRMWRATIGHIGVFTAAAARGRGLAAIVGAAASQYTMREACIPQWRSLMSNTVSARVAERLGFVVVGRQLTARVRDV